MWGERCGRVHGVNKEVRWGVGGSQGSCGKRYGGCGGRCREMCWGVWGGKERSVGRVWESVWGEWGSVLACGERMWREEWGRCREMCWGVGPQHTFNSPHLPTLTFPYISPYLPHTPSHFPTPPFIPLPTSLLPPPLPNIFSYYPHTSPFTFSKCGEVTMWRSFCGEVTVAKLPCGEVTGNRVDSPPCDRHHSTTTFVFL